MNKSYKLYRGWYRWDARTPWRDSVYAVSTDGLHDQKLTPSCGDPGEDLDRARRSARAEGIENRVDWAAGITRIGWSGNGRGKRPTTADAAAGRKPERRNGTAPQQPEPSMEAAPA